MIRGEMIVGRNDTGAELHGNHVYFRCGPVDTNFYLHRKKKKPVSKYVIKLLKNTFLRIMCCRAKKKATFSHETDHVHCVLVYCCYKNFPSLTFFIYH
jgi:predicted transcriptional regulator